MSEIMSQREFKKPANAHTLNVPLKFGQRGIYCTCGARFIVYGSKANGGQRISFLDLTAYCPVCEATFVFSAVPPQENLRDLEIHRECGARR